MSISVASNWEDARSEWELHLVYTDPDARSCECGHQPIHQICVIKNKDNGNEAEVGNVCVHKFMQLASQRIFSVLRRIRADNSKSLNPKALELFLRRKVISQIEHDDYKSYWRRRKNMTDEQRDQKLDINLRVLDYIDRETQVMIAKFRSHKLKPRKHLELV